MLFAGTAPRQESPARSSRRSARRSSDESAARFSSVAHAATTPLLESLESRMMLAFSADINFAPSNAPLYKDPTTGAAYLVDSGAVYGSRGGGQTFGWNASNTANLRWRMSSKSPDIRYDTLDLLQKGGTYAWEIAVPKGLYNVTIVAGDPVSWDSIYRINAEGVLTVSGTPTGTNPWIQGASTVAVTDGRLTISNGTGAVNNRINFIRISDAAPTQFTANPSSSTQVDLSWKNNAVSATGFWIDRSTDGVNFTTIATVASNVTSFSDTGLSGGTTYTYRVSASNSTGTSAPAQVSATTPTPPTPAAPAPAATPAVPLGVNVMDFGAVGDGVTDDTAAIQRAIDSLAVQFSVANPQSPQGGIVYLPNGTYRTTAPLIIKSGIVLEGQSPGGVVIHNTDTDPTHAALSMTIANSTVPYVSGTVVKNLTIRTDFGYGIRAASGSPYFVHNRFKNLNISAGNWAIYLPAAEAYVQNCYFTNIHVQDMGAGALWIDGNANHLNGVVTEGTARSTFSATPAIIRVGGEGNGIRNCVVGGVPTGVPAAAYYVTGDQLSWRNNWETLPTGQNGSVYTFDTLSGASIDQLNGLNTTHAATFTNANNVYIDQLNLLGSAQTNPLSQFLSLDSLSTVRVGTVVRTSTLPTAPLVPALSAPAVPPTISAASFGAVGDGVTDATDAIQKAIDSAAAGTTVYLPKGKYLLSAPLRLKSGVTLMGEDTGTVLYNIDPNSANAAILLMPDSTGTATATGITDLTIWTQSTYGIRAGGTGVMNVSQLNLQNLVISAGNWGIYLPASQAYVTNANINDIFVPNAGQGAAWVDGDNNLIQGINTEAGLRPGFVNAPALVRIGGNNNTIRGCIIEGAPDGVPVIAYYVTGQNVTWENNWAELMMPQNNTNYWFDHVTGMHVDEFMHITDAGMAKFTNCTGVVIDTLSIGGTITQLSHTLNVDATTKIAIHEVCSRYDTGDLDKFAFDGCWSMINQDYVNTRALATAGNAIANADFSNGMNNWSVVSSDPALQYTASIDAGPTGNRLKITILQNPNNSWLQVVTNFTLPAGVTSEPAYAAFNTTADPGMRALLMYQWNSGLTRAQNGTTTAKLPNAGNGDTSLHFLIGTGAGTVYLQNVQVTLMTTDPRIFVNTGA